MLVNGRSKESGMSRKAPKREPKTAFGQVLVTREKAERRGGTADMRSIEFQDETKLRPIQSKGFLAK